MKLKETAIVIQEETTQIRSYGELFEVSNYWGANLEAYEEKTNAIVQMSRQGNSPTEALENLLKAMKEAGMRT